MNYSNTQDLGKFGHRELHEAEQLLNAYNNKRWSSKEQEEDFWGDGVAVEFNPYSGLVFLVNKEYQVAVIGHLDSKERPVLEMFYTCSECGNEGTLSDGFKDGCDCNHFAIEEQEEEEEEVDEEQLATEFFLWLREQVAGDKINRYTQEIFDEQGRSVYKSSEEELKKGLEHNERLLENISHNWLVNQGLSKGNDAYIDDGISELLCHLDDYELTLENMCYKCESTSNLSLEVFGVTLSFNKGV